MRVNAFFQDKPVREQQITVGPLSVRKHYLLPFPERLLCSHGKPLLTVVCVQTLLSSVTVKRNTTSNDPCIGKGLLRRTLTCRQCEGGNINKKVLRTVLGSSLCPSQIPTRQLWHSHKLVLLLLQALHAPRLQRPTLLAQLHCEAEGGTQS